MIAFEQIRWPLRNDRFVKQLIAEVIVMAYLGFSALHRTRT